MFDTAGLVLRIASHAELCYRMSVVFLTRITVWENTGPSRQTIYGEILLYFV